MNSENDNFSKGSGAQVNLGVSPLSWTNDVLAELFNSAVREGLFTVSGDGIVDFAQIGKYVPAIRV